MGGYTLMDRKTINDVLLWVYRETPKVSSDFIRAKAQETAALASLGFISTKDARHTFGRKWRITPEGLQFLREEGIL